jgi:hypothetical protein
MISNWTIEGYLKAFFEFSTGSKIIYEERVWDNG